MSVDRDDPLAPARGCLNALMLSIPFWLVVGFLLWLWLK